jgi:alcohol dehydrogenase class IV
MASQMAASTFTDDTVVTNGASPKLVAARAVLEAKRRLLSAEKRLVKPGMVQELTAKPINVDKSILASRNFRPLIDLYDPEPKQRLPSLLTTRTARQPATVCIEALLSSRANLSVDAVDLDGIKPAVKDLCLFPISKMVIGK